MIIKMMSKIIKDIKFLKTKYHHPKNQYKYQMYVSEEEFKKKMKMFSMEDFDNIKIVDGKYYFDKDTILEIFENGIMNAYYNKIFKYINYDNKSKLILCNNKKINIDDFHFKQNYNKIIIMKKIIFMKDNNSYEFNVCINENKETSFYINFIITSSNKIDSFTDILSKFTK
jgi:hypothetical protein